MNNDPRYVPVEEALPAILPPITREEAKRAVRKLFAHFGNPEHGSALQTRKARNRYGADCRDGVRKVWVSAKCTPGSNHDRGWGRLIHDVSHDLFAQRCPTLRPHNNAHALVEVEVARYVVAQGWLDGKLRPKVKAPPTLDERRLAELANLDKRIAKWETRAKRAQTALRKLNAKHDRLVRAMNATSTRRRVRIIIKEQRAKR